MTTLLAMNLVALWAVVLVASGVPAVPNGMPQPPAMPQGPMA